MTNKELNQAIDALCVEYDTVIKVMDQKAEDSADRAYGGVLRAVKGGLQEYLTENLIAIAWGCISNDKNRLRIDKSKVKISIKPNYVDKINDEEIKQHLQENLGRYFYNISVDKHAYIDGKFVLGIECKAYTENAMIKRILVDFSLLKTKYPEMTCYLFQLESQLGGDYSELNAKSFGSPSTHTLQSYFGGVDLNIHTFVKGERKVNQPIHKNYKPISKEKLHEAVAQLSADLSNYL